MTSVSDAQQTGNNQSAMEDLLDIMSKLRNPEHGCPWDLEQSIQSLAPYTIEEVYEVVDAIERDDLVDLEDELGDLLFQVVFYAQLANEQQAFDFSDVARAISNKLLRRHPHVFPGGKVENFGKDQDLSPEQVVVNWEAIKEQERAEKRSKRGSAQEEASPASVLDDVPRALPALERARKLQKRAARNGFDWTDTAPVLAKLKEEIGELEDALSDAASPADSHRIQHELGDVLFSVVNLARHLDQEPESALRSANERFENRFRWIESKLQDKGGSLQNASLQELDALWDQAKESGL